MEREIKFRAWIKDLEVMILPVTFYSHTNSIGVEASVLQEALPEKVCICEDGIYKDDPEHDVFELITSVLEGDDWYWFEEGQFEIMQYVGLKDKNGVEIYEGDLLTEWYKGIRRKNRQVEVFYNHKFCCFSIYQDGEDGSEFIDQETTSEYGIVGNIHASQGMNG